MKAALLLFAALIYGLAGVVVFRRFTNREALRVVTNRIIAHVLEFRLFVDEPLLILRAQRDLVRANIALLRQIAIPSLLLAVFFAVTYFPMNRYFGTGALRIGEATIAEVQSDDPALDLIAPFGVTVETPALRVGGEHLTMWRIRALSPISGDFRTVPRPHSVKVRYPDDRYLGMPWVVAFGLLASGVSLAATVSKYPRLTPVSDR